MFRVYTSEKSRVSDVTRRQREIAKFALGTVVKTSTDFLRKAAAILVPDRLNPITLQKIVNDLPRLLERLDMASPSDLDKIASDAKLRERIRNEVGIISALPPPNSIVLKRSPVLRTNPTTSLELCMHDGDSSLPNLDEGHFELRSVPSRAISLYDFERFAFDNDIRTRYEEIIDFGTYIWDNLLNYFGANEYREGLGEGDWRGELLRLLNAHCAQRDKLAVHAFYDDYIELSNGQYYDARYIPKYPVLDLDKIEIPTARKMEIERNLPSVSDFKAWQKFDPRVETSYNIDSSLGRMFRVLPFKNGYVMHKGRIQNVAQAIDSATAIPPTNHITTVLRIAFDLSRRSHVCGPAEVDSVIESLWGAVTWEDALYSVVMNRAFTIAQNLFNLLLLKRMLWGTQKLKIANVKIQLPSDEVLYSYLFTHCAIHAANDPSPTSVYARALLPPTGPSVDEKRVSRQVDLVRQIAASAQSFGAACLAASRWRLIELDFATVFRRLDTQAERYVALTMLMQDYPENELYWLLREDLVSGVEFGIESTLKTLPSPSDNADLLARAYWSSPRSIATRANPEIVDAGGSEFCNKNYCSPVTCPQLYEFVDENLRKLCENPDISFGELDLTDRQIASYLLVTSV